MEKTFRIILCKQCQRKVPDFYYCSYCGAIIKPKPKKPPPYIYRLIKEKVSKENEWFLTVELDRYICKRGFKPVILKKQLIGIGELLEVSEEKIKGFLLVYKDKKVFVEYIHNIHDEPTSGVTNLIEPLDVDFSQSFVNYKNYLSYLKPYDKLWRFIRKKF